jgi:5,10-methylenetetrahydromethanopterin reductase
VRVIHIGVSTVDEGRASFEARLRDVEAGRFDLLGIGDSPRFADVYVSLAVAALATTTVRLGPLVTNPVTRALAVTRNAIESVAQLAPGRAFLGLGTGDSAVAGVRRRPASLGALRDAIGEMRRAPAPSWPVLVAANGPATLRAAGEVADGVVIGSGVSPHTLRAALVAVEAGLAAGGRDPVGFERWVVVRCWITDDPQRDQHRCDLLLASAANHVFARRPPADARPDLVAAVAELRRRYDYAYHGVAGENPNAALVDRLGLRPYLRDRFAWIDTPEGLVRRCAGPSGRWRC